jgi:two-component system OmpR family sensor kinase
VQADPERVTQILTNLTNNARTAAGDQGTVQIHVRGVPAYAEIVVQDNGPGVQPVDRERIFRRLVHSPATRGSGLGLPIARGFARAHGGDLTCVDRPDGQPGAAFRLVLPVG